MRHSGIKIVGDNPKAYRSVRVVRRGGRRLVAIFALQALLASAIFACMMYLPRILPSSSTAIDTVKTAFLYDFNTSKAPDSYGTFGFIEELKRLLTGGAKEEAPIKFALPIGGGEITRDGDSVVIDGTKNSVVSAPVDCVVKEIRILGAERAVVMKHSSGVSFTIEGLSIVGVVVGNGLKCADAIGMTESGRIKITASVPGVIDKIFELLSDREEV